jgi:hypothetical protein
LKRHPSDRSAAVCGPVDSVVADHHEISVGGEVHLDLHEVGTDPDTSRKAYESVFGSDIPTSR